MVVKWQEDELARAKATVDKAEKAQIKAFCKAVATKRRDMVKVRTTQKRLKKEPCKEISGSRQRYGQKDSAYLCR